MGPALSETFQTPSLLRELGISYVLDWTADDQPFVQCARLISVPIRWSSTTSLVPQQSFSGDDFHRMVITNSIDSRRSARAAGEWPLLAPLHHRSAFRHKYLRSARHIAGHEGVWTHHQRRDSCALLQLRG